MTDIDDHARKFAELLPPLTADEVESIGRLAAKLDARRASDPGGVLAASDIARLEATSAVFDLEAATSLTAEDLAKIAGSDKPPQKALATVLRRRASDIRARKQREAELDIHIKRIVDEAPALTAEQRDRLAVLLRA